MTPWKDKISNNFFAFSLLIAVLFVTGVGLSDYRNAKFNSEPYYEMNEDWIYEDEEGKSYLVTLPVKMQTWSKSQLELSRNLPDNLVPGMTMCILTTEQKIEAFVDDKKIYSYGMNGENVLGNSTGSLWNMIRIPSGVEGKALRIKITKVYKGDRRSDTICSIYYGSKSSLIYKIGRTYAISSLISILVIIMGIIILFAYLIYRKNLEDNQMTLDLGWFTVLVGLWMFGENKTTQIFMGNQFLVCTIIFLSLLLFPIPMLRYIGKMKGYHFKKIMNIFIVLFFVNFIYCIVMQMLNIMDFYESIFFVRILILSSVVVIGITLCVEVFYYHNKEAFQFTCVLLLMLCFVMKELSVYYSGDMSGTGISIGLGILFFITALLVGVVKRTVRALEMIKSVKYYEELAIIDLMTGCKNRTAYMNDLNCINADEKNLSSMGICLMDINDLKKINDIYGHQMGDAAITKCSEYIEQIYGYHGKCYRIGGDEFTCVMPNTKEEEMEKYKEKFLSLCNIEDRKNQYRFQVALGYAVFDKNKDSTIEDVVKRADANMYNLKSAMKDRNIEVY